jgi:hypothetical protein
MGALTKALKTNKNLTTTKKRAKKKRGAWDSTIANITRIVTIKASVQCK